MNTTKDRMKMTLQAKATDLPTRVFLFDGIFWFEFSFVGIGTGDGTSYAFALVLTMFLVKAISWFYSLLF